MEPAGHKKMLTLALLNFSADNLQCDKPMRPGSVGKKKQKGRYRYCGPHVPRTKGKRSASLKSR